MNLKAKKLSEFLYEDKFPAKDRTEIWFNLLEIYNLPFNKETVENLFELTDALVGENWEDFHKFADQYFICDVESLPTNVHATNIPAYPIPKTISDFIEDCDRIWNFPLLWDGNLIRRKFKYIP